MNPAEFTTLAEDEESVVNPVEHEVLTILCDGETVLIQRADGSKRSMHWPGKGKLVFIPTLALLVMIVGAMVIL